MVVLEANPKMLQSPTTCVCYTYVYVDVDIHSQCCASVGYTSLHMNYEYLGDHVHFKKEFRSYPICFCSRQHFLIYPFSIAVSNQIQLAWVHMTRNWYRTSFTDNLNTSFPVYSDSDKFPTP